MTDIIEISEDGFLLPDYGGKITSLALLSLRLAIKSFFETYQIMKYSLHVFDKNLLGTELDEREIDFQHTSTYIEKSTEAVLHLHHFIELVCKDFLRAENQLLADEPRTNHVILHKLIKGEPLTDEDTQKLRSIEFNKALDRLCTLIDEQRIDEYSSLRFISKDRKFLAQLNTLRNRLLHRGIYSLRYPALDKLFGEYALPFIQNVIVLPLYSGNEGFWKYIDLYCGIDPIELIIGEFQSSSETYNTGKVAMLKELGRAAFHQPRFAHFRVRDIGKKKYRPYFVDNGLIERAERIATTETSNVAEVRICPVCGVKSLVIYDDIEVEGEDPIEGTYEKAWRHTCQVVCMSCTFEVNHHLGNPSDYDLPFDDFWYGEELS